MLKAASAKNAAIHFFPEYEIVEQHVDGNTTYFKMLRPGFDYDSKTIKIVMVRCELCEPGSYDVIQTMESLQYVEG